VSGRGLVLVMKDGWQGKIAIGGVVESERGSEIYSGPDFVDAKEQSWIAVTVPTTAKEKFSPGASVKFYAPATPKFYPLAKPKRENDRFWRKLLFWHWGRTGGIKP